MFVFLFPVFQLRALRTVCRCARMLVAAPEFACLHGFAFAAAFRTMPAGVRRRAGASFMGAAALRVENLRAGHSFIKLRRHALR